jgi:trans-aconitate methyltransferase
MKKYKWNADEYSKFSSAQHKWAKESIEKVKLKKNENVLDVGCGEGRVTAEIAGYVPEGSVLGIDSSEEMISLAKNKFPPAKYPNLSFQVLDARELNFNSRFDVILSNAALHWVDNHIKILKGMYNSLKEGGRILLQMGGKGNVEEAFFAINKTIEDFRWKDYFSNFKFPYYFFGVEEYNDFLLQAKFKKSRIELIEKDMQHKGKEGIKGWIKTTWLPYIENVPQQEREIFIEELLKNFVKNFPPDERGIYHVKAMRLIAEAEK